jgi:hypothetical protein
MAGDWIKMRGNLWDDPRVARLVDMTDSSEAAVVGGLYWLWATADQHTQDGLMPGLSLRQIDRKTGVQGLGKALCDIGWLSETDSGVRVENFEEHNGQSAKRRCVDAQRKATVRTVSASDADKTQTSSGQETPNLGAREREEKRREEDKEAIASSSASAQPTCGDEPDDGVPPCPFDPLIDLYEAALPVLPTVRRSLFAKGANGKALRARWRWVMTAKHERGERKGERIATTVDEGKAWFGRYFDYVAESDFLSGRSGKFQACDLGWLVTAANFEKVLSGKYHHEQREVAYA